MVGVDIVPSFLACVATTPSVSPTLASLDQLPFCSDSFDRVLTVTSIQHVMGPALDAIARELVRVTRPQGLLVCVEYSPIAGAPRDSVYQRMHTLDEWLESFAVAGASVVKVRGVRYTVHRVAIRADRHWWWRPALIAASALDRLLAVSDRGGRHSDVHAMIFRKLA